MSQKAHKSVCVFLLLVLLGGLISLSSLITSPSVVFAKETKRSKEPKKSEASKQNEENSGGEKKDVKDLKGRLIMPKVESRVRAIYPPEALENALTAKVKLVIVIDEKGNVSEATVPEKAGHGFDEAALEAVKGFKFSPARLDGKPVPVKIVVVYPFSLKREPKKGDASGDRPDAKADDKADAKADDKPVGKPDGKQIGGSEDKEGKKQSDPTKPGEVPTEKTEGLTKEADSSEETEEKWRTMLSGTVMERGTRNPLADAVCVAIPITDKAQPATSTPTQVYSDENGRFVFKELRPGRYRVQIKTPNHRSFETKETISPGGRVKVRYYLERISFDVYETVVTSKAQREEVSRHVVALAEIQRIPGTQGDALKSVQNLPGVARAPFGAGLLVVRGSAPGDTNVLLHGHPIPILFHFGGLTSVINSDILKQIEFIPGNFSVRHGGAIGGIIDVQTRPAKKRWHGYVDIDIWDAGLLLEGPLGKGSFALSARRSYIDAILSAVPLDDFPIAFQTAPAYYDYQAMLDYPVLGGNLKVLLLGSDDRLKFLFNEPSGLSPTAQGGQLALLFHRALAIYKKRIGDYTIDGSLSSGFQQIDGNLGDGSFGLTLSILNTYWRAEVTRRFSKELSLSLGIDGYYAWAKAVASIPDASTDQELRPITGRDINETSTTAGAYAQALYLEGTWKPHKVLTLIPGLRLDYYNSLGFSRYSFDPRLKANVEVHKNVDLKFGIGLFHQPPQITDLLTILGGSSQLGYEQGLHISGGTQWRAPGGVEINATGFYKHLNNLVSRTYDAIIEDGEIRAENKANAGTGRIYGMELLLKKPLTGYCPKVLGIERCFGWMAYTLMRSERKEDPSIHNDTTLPPGAPTGEYALFDWDQTHLLTMILTVMFKRNWEFGLRFRYATGLPTSPVTGGIYDADADAYIQVPSLVNSERVPHFHQLDVRVDKKWIFKTWRLSAYIDIQNVYARKNPEFANYNFNYTQRRWIPGLPIVPSFGIKGEF